MIFQKKLNATIDWLKEKSKLEFNIEEEHIKLEKNDMLALFLSALLVFSPFLLVLIGILFWSYSF
ncbi:MAG: DUF4342 domain-containing protein [Sporanaerobacter sp.]|jgi:hypothetical protein|uniref:hypothetical protein n=1 Tax=Sporanaerobacter sp. TaxID=2010183 RepID=UPI003A10372E